jgi:hypothetical protein
VTPDPKWLDVFRDSDIQLAVTVACGLFLAVAHFAKLPLPDWVSPLVLFVGILSGCLVAVAALSAWLKARG